MFRRLSRDTLVRKLRSKRVTPDWATTYEAVGGVPGGSLASGQVVLPQAQQPTQQLSNSLRQHNSRPSTSASADYAYAGIYISEMPQEAAQSVARRPALRLESPRRPRDLPRKQQLPLGRPEQGALRGVHEAQTAESMKMRRACLQFLFPSTY